MDAEKAQKILEAKEGRETFEAHAALFLETEPTERVAQAFWQEAARQAAEHLAKLSSYPASASSPNQYKMSPDEANRHDNQEIDFGEFRGRCWADVPLHRLDYYFQVSLETVRYYNSDLVQSRYRKQPGLFDDRGDPDEDGD
ncbi:MAG: hypothetical protein B7Z37_26590 [Verrucomicrobia bacterium 12-59-8]|nr:MAG: hypothetical protein B7Z37_26590 [Verrucomicrobia bacterium 12-59-8]